MTAALIDPTSLAATLLNLQPVLECKREATEAERREVAGWLLGRMNSRGSYGRMPAPTENDFASGVRIFTGERLTSHASIAHILGEEACRALRLLDVENPAIDAALDQVDEEMIRRVWEGRRKGRERGHTQLSGYCCGKCSDAFWRHMEAGGFSELDHEAEFRAGLDDIHDHRKPDGSWSRYPFYFTVSALIEMDHPHARRELAFAAPRLERALKRSAGDGDPYQHQREFVARHALARV